MINIPPMNRVSASDSRSFFRRLPAKRSRIPFLIAGGDRRWLRKRRERPAYRLCEYLDCSQHLIRHRRIVRHKNFDGRSGEAGPYWVSRNEIADGAGKDTKADDRAGLGWPAERCLLEHMSVIRSIHRIDFKPGGNHVVGCAGRVGRARQGNDNSARLDRRRKDRQTDSAMGAAEDRGTPCVLCVRTGNAVFEDVGHQLPADVAVRRRPVDPGPGVEDHAAASDYSCGYGGIEPQLDAFVVRVAPVLPWAVMHSPRPATSKLD